MKMKLLLLAAAVPAAASVAHAAPIGPQPLPDRALVETVKGGHGGGHGRFGGGHGRFGGNRGLHRGWYIGRGNPRRWRRW